MRLRIGQGFDVHALVPGRPLLLGGVAIPHAQGLLGHSDADVLLHAVTDALLGAACLGDIGQWFPDTDDAHRDADSRALLQSVASRVRGEGWRVVNLDCTVVAQQPKIAPFVPTMRQTIAVLLEADLQAVSVKGKTTEHLGFTGRHEGIAAFAVVLLQAA
jgi:2-C-methyl-D-erythritol 2,4-cyclodiphosphate synthase